MARSRWLSMALEAGRTSYRNLPNGIEIFLVNGARLCITKEGHLSLYKKAVALDSLSLEDQHLVEQLLKKNIWHHCPSSLPIYNQRDAR